MNLFKFSRPKGPGYGISGDFYLSVLSGTARLPAIVEVLNPSGGAGAVEGFGAPLAPDAEKSDLARPMERGAYALATKDRKTLIRMLVLSKEEDHFDPEAVLRSAMAAEFSDEMKARIRSTWTILQLTFETHDASVFPSLGFLLSVVQRIAELTQGVVADPISERYLLPDQVSRKPLEDDPFHIFDHVAVCSRLMSDGITVYTLGLRKFAFPEVELKGVDEAAVPAATGLLANIARAVLLKGLKLVPGQLVKARSVPLQIAEGGLDRAMWGEIPCLELIPPTGWSAADALGEGKGSGSG